jgi:hypothetical protein
MITRPYSSPHIIVVSSILGNGKVARDELSFAMKGAGVNRLGIKFPAMNCNEVYYEWAFHFRWLESQDYHEVLSNLQTRHTALLLKTTWTFCILYIN